MQPQYTRGRQYECSELDICRRFHTMQDRFALMRIPLASFLDKFRITLETWNRLLPGILPICETVYILS